MAKRQHSVKLWSKKRNRQWGAVSARREYHAECDCGWQTMVLCRADRKVDVAKHREAAAWADRGMALSA